MSDFKTIPLTKGYEAIVDAEDYEWLSKWKWTAITQKKKKSVYAKRVAYVKGSGAKNPKHISYCMHRLIIKAPKGMSVDHINQNSLDNRKCNLRLCTNAENIRNVSKRRLQTTSKYKGVCYRPHRNMWDAYITLDRKIIHLGRFSTEKEAARAYNVAAPKYHQEFSSLNEVLA